MPTKLTEDERHAQRRLIGLLNGGAHVYLCRAHLGIFRESSSEEWKTTAREVTDALDVLDIPYTVTLMSGMFPTKKSHPRGRHGTDVRILWDDFASVLHWMPSFQKHIDWAEAADPADMAPPEDREIRGVRPRVTGFFAVNGDVVLLGPPHKL